MRFIEEIYRPYFTNRYIHTLHIYKTTQDFRIYYSYNIKLNHSLYIKPHSTSCTLYWTSSE